MAKKLKNTISKEYGKGVIAFLTEEEWIKAREWTDGSCEVCFQESHPEEEKRPGRAYYLDISIFNPSHDGDGRGFMRFTHNFPYPKSIAEGINYFLTNKEYTGKITFRKWGESDWTLKRVQEELSKIYKKGEVIIG
jgi:hypothetical protein